MSERFSPFGKDPDHIAMCINNRPLKERINVELKKLAIKRGLSAQLFNKKTRLSNIEIEKIDLL